MTRFKVKVSAYDEDGNVQHPFNKTLFDLMEDKWSLGNFSQFNIGQPTSLCVRRTEDDDYYSLEVEFDD